MQSRLRSATESLATIILGMGYAVPLNYVFLTKIEWSSPWSQSLWMVAWFTALSFVFKYTARRFFNWLDVKYPS